jgi:hypothetical protein
VQVREQLEHSPRQFSRRAQLGLGLALVMVVISLAAHAATSAAPARADGCTSTYCGYTYCYDVLIGPGVSCGSVCDWHNGGTCSEGGWDMNFFNYYGNGKVDGCEEASDANGHIYQRCPFRDNGNDQYHFNSAGDLCPDWYAGVSSTLGVSEYNYSHHVYGSGHYLINGAACPQ